jgi:Protein of unknown function (DUF1573)/Flagellar-associated PapD-like
LTAVSRAVIDIWMSARGRQSHQLEDTDRQSSGKMRRLILAIFMALICAAPAAAQNGENPLIPGANAAPPGPQPKAVVTDPLYDFGSALEGKMVNHTFTLKNEGQGTLEIRGTKTSCGCTVASPKTSHLGPGEETTIDVGFDTHFQKGHQVRTIIAYTNDPDNPNATMTMQGNVKQQVASTPPQIDFGSVRQGTGENKDVTISDLVGGSPQFEVGQITNTNNAIKVEKVPAAAGQPTTQLKVSLLPSMPTGPFDDTIKVMTNRIPLNIDVFGTVNGDLSLDPAQVSFGIVKSGQEAMRILKLSNQGQRAVKVLDITSSDPSVSAAAEPITPGKEYKITVMLRRGVPDGQLRGQLAIKTDDPKQASIEVPFYAIVGRFNG